MTFEAEIVDFGPVLAFDLPFDPKEALGKCGPAPGSRRATG